MKRWVVTTILAVAIMTAGMLMSHSEARTQGLPGIFKGAGADSGVSVPPSSANREGALYRSFVFPSTLEGVNEIKWMGYTQGLFLDAFGNVREDSNGDGRLVYEEDTIIRTRLDTTTNEAAVDRFQDQDGNGLADSSSPTATVELRDVEAIWEAGNELARTASEARRVFTWVDTDHNGVVDSGEQIEFATANSPALAPYLRAEATPPFSSDNIINFICGDHIAGMRNRQLMLGGSLQVWKLGDSIHSQPMVLGAPVQAHDVMHEDPSYSAFFVRYQHRRHVAYVGANDAMLHAFNAGYFHEGDDPSTTSKREHGWFTRTPTENNSGPLLGEELFGFIPQELLPHLKRLTQPEYPHVEYIDLQPNVTDARIFTPDADHPNGWGTILLGGFRLGRSCANCVAGAGAPPSDVPDDLSRGGGTTDSGYPRVSYTAYFVLDITNPESPEYPKLLWSFSRADSGSTSSEPAMVEVRLNNSAARNSVHDALYDRIGVPDSEPIVGPTSADGSDYLISNPKMGGGRATGILAHVGSSESTSPGKPSS